MSCRARDFLLLSSLVLAAGCAFAPPGERGGRFTLESRAVIQSQDYYRSLGELASIYLAFDLREVERSDYRDGGPGGDRLTLERLTFGSAPEALGLFNLERNRRKPSFTQRWPFGYLTDDRFVCVRGATLLRVIAPLGRSESALALGTATGAHPTYGNMPAQVGALLDVGVDPWDLLWEPERILGSAALAPGMTAPLPRGPVGSSIFLLAKATPADANAALLAFLDSQTAGGKRGVSFTIGVGDIAAGLQDPERGWISLARRGNVIAGTSGLAGSDDGWPLLSLLLASLE